MPSLVGRSAGSIVVLALAVGAAAAGSRPNLAEKTISVSPHAVQAGGRVRVTDVVVNRGRTRSVSSTTGFYLSRDRKRGGDRRLGRRPIGPLGPGKESIGTTALLLPSAAAGSYYVLACADDRRRVRETTETDNCRATARAVRVTAPGDRSPPVFAGLKSATTCIPGPVGQGRTAPYRLAWDPASDDVTPQSAIVYDVYQATRPGGEDFSTATYTTDPGAITFTTPPLSSTVAYYFVVRARDAAGNRDSNVVERMGVNPCV